MPAGRPEAGGGSGVGAPGATGRTSFRPPWVKEGPSPLPMPAAPWTLANRNKEPASKTQEPAPTQSADGQPARKTSSIKITPMQPTENGTTRDPHTFERPKLREVPKAPPKEPTRLQSREVKVPVTIARKEPKEIPIQVHIESKKTEPPPQAPKQDLQPLKKDAPREQRNETQIRDNKRNEPEPREVKRNEPEVREVKRNEPQVREVKRQDPEPREAKPQGRETKRNEPDSREVRRNDLQGREVKRNEPETREVKTNEAQGREMKKNEQQAREVPIKREIPVEKSAEKSAKVWDENENNEKAIPSQRNNIVRQDSSRKLSMPAPPPLPPPPPPGPDGLLSNKQPLTKEKREKIEMLKSRPRKRPDWAAMIREIEGGAKLKHVQCNDRSKPLLPKNKAKGQFIYESEQANLHNQLLKQIQMGKPLKHVKTNDRSKPILEGLRKFRRQMTIEEQIIKSQSMANMPEAEIEDEVDEMDDIDKVRDDLQSTKQMLALELRNKEAQIRENKRLQARILNLEAELEKERALLKSQEQQQQPGAAQLPAADEKLIKSLKEEASDARKAAVDLEKKFHQTADELDGVKNELEDAKRQNQLLERKLQQALQGLGGKRQSFSDRRESVPGKPQEDEESDFEVESESESESEEEDNEEKQKRRLERELRLLRNKLKSYKNKEEAAKRERKSLRELMKKNQKVIKEEKKKYRKLQKEVNKMAALMKDDEEDDEEKEEEEEEEETETEESETESESETSEEEESSDSEAEDTPLDKQKESLHNRAKKHENYLNALKKGNYMLKANVDRLQDDLNKQKEMVISLQEDLDSVLAELG